MDPLEGQKLVIKNKFFQAQWITSNSKHGEGFYYENIGDALYELRRRKEYVKPSDTSQHIKVTEISIYSVDVNTIRS